MRQAMDLKEAELLGKLEAGMKGRMQDRAAAVLNDLDIDRLLHVRCCRLTCLLPSLAPFIMLTSMVGPLFKNGNV